MKRRMKFRFWDKDKMFMVYTDSIILPIDDRYFELMQFTGLKDKNGKEIYEGDVITSYDKNIIIEWDNDVAGFNISYNVTECVILPYEIEVVGNIYENPELREL